MLCWFHLGFSAIIQRRRGGLLGRHHFTPPIPLRHRWNIIRCLLTFKSCSAAVISIGLAAISVKCPLATLPLHMEDFLSPSMVPLFYFAPSLHLAFYPTCPLKPDCDEGWGTPCTKEMSHHRRCCCSKDKTKNTHSIGLWCLFCTVFLHKKMF